MTLASGSPIGGRGSRDCCVNGGPRPSSPLWREVVFVLALGAGMYLIACGVML